MIQREDSNDGYRTNRRERQEKDYGKSVRLRNKKRKTTKNKKNDKNNKTKSINL